MKKRILNAIKLFKLRLLFKAVCIGVVGGLVIVGYKYLLEFLHTSSVGIYSYIRQKPALIPVMVAALSGLAWLTAMLIKVEPLVRGGGIPQVKAQLDHGFSTAWWRVMLCKIAGSAMSMFGGLSLGREGPSVQLGAATAEGLAYKSKRNARERRFLIACGAGAGVAAAFNAPFAGAILALEELRQDFNPRALLAALASSISATLVSNVLSGSISSVFRLTTDNLPLHAYGYVIIVGICLGLIGVLYNKLLLSFGDALSRAKAPMFVRVLPAFIAAGFIALYLPWAAYDGHYILDEIFANPSASGLLGGLDGLSALAVLLVVQFAFSILCFGGGAIGGNFFPVMVTGGLFGTLAGLFFSEYLGMGSELILSFALLGMAGALTAVVRAPVTAIILVLELTGSFSHLLPFALAVVLCHIVPDIFNSQPIYHSLLNRLDLSQLQATDAQTEMPPNA